MKLESFVVKVRKFRLVLPVVMLLTLPGLAAAQESDRSEVFLGCSEGTLNRVCSKVEIDTLSLSEPGVDSYRDLHVRVKTTVWTNGVLRQGSMTTSFFAFNRFDQTMIFTTPRERCDWDGIFAAGCSTVHHIVLEGVCHPLTNWKFGLSASHDASSNILDDIQLTRHQRALLRYVDSCYAELSQ